MKVGVGGHDPRNVREAAPKAGKSKELDLPLEPLEGAWSCPCLDFSPEKLILGGPEKIIVLREVYYFKSPQVQKLRHRIL